MKSGFEMDITKVDKNFIVESNINIPDIKFYDAKEAPFKIYGVFYEDERFRRMPKAIAKTVNDGVAGLHEHTAGGRIRFKTNSPYVAINTKMPHVGKMPHFALTGSSGFDLYIKEDGMDRYFRSFVPPFAITNGYESVIEFGNNDIKEITIDMPLYSSVSEIYVGLSQDAEVFEPEEYAIKTPIVYYGSSITQGGCASRPGSCYTARISRELNADYINLGFSGSARGEDAIGEYIAGLNMSCFVYDYDHNSPSLETLENTHERCFKIIREKNPDLPIVILSRPKFKLTDDEEARFKVIEKTYENAKAKGDNNVYLIKGTKLMEKAGFESTVDNCHPTDLGFASMGDAIAPVLKKIFNL